MYLDLGRWINRICIVLEWTPEEANLLQDRPSLAVCCSVSLHLKGTWETQNHQKFCMRLVLVSFTINLQLLHDHLKSPNHQFWVPEDQGTGVMMSQCMKLVLVPL